VGRKWNKKPQQVAKSLVAVAKKRNNSLEKVVAGDKKSLEKVEVKKNEQQTYMR
jgi:hypothetical protein